MKKCVISLFCSLNFIGNYSFANNDSTLVNTISQISLSYSNEVSTTENNQIILPFLGDSITYNTLEYNTNEDYFIEKVYKEKFDDEWEQGNPDCYYDDSDIYGIFLEKDQNKNIIIDVLPNNIYQSSMWATICMNGTNSFQGKQSVFIPYIRRFDFSNAIPIDSLESENSYSPGQVIKYSWTGKDILQYGIASNNKKRSTEKTKWHTPYIPVEKGDEVIIQIGKGLIETDDYNIIYTKDSLGNKEDYRTLTWHIMLLSSRYNSQNIDTSNWGISGKTLGKTIDEYVTHYYEAIDCNDQIGECYIKLEKDDVLTEDTLDKVHYICWTAFTDFHINYAGIKKITDCVFNVYVKHHDEETEDISFTTVDKNSNETSFNLFGQKVNNISFNTNIIIKDNKKLITIH